MLSVSEFPDRHRYGLFSFSQHWCYLMFSDDLTDAYVSLEHKHSLQSLGYICSNNQQNIVWVKIIHFSFMPKIIRILRSCSMKIFSKFPTINISKLHFWLLICIAKSLIWTTLKMIFSIFRLFCSLRFQIFKYCPIITNHTSMEILFIQLSDDAYISISKNWHLWLVL